MLILTMLYPDIREYTDTRKAANDAVNRIGGTNLKIKTTETKTEFTFTHDHVHYSGIANRYTFKGQRYMNVCALPTTIKGFI